MLWVLSRTCVEAPDMEALDSYETRNVMTATSTSVCAPLQHTERVLFMTRGDLNGVRTGKQLRSCDSRTMREGTSATRVTPGYLSLSQRGAESDDSYSHAAVRERRFRSPPGFTRPKGRGGPGRNGVAGGPVAASFSKPRRLVGGDVARPIARAPARDATTRAICYDTI